MELDEMISELGNIHPRKDGKPRKKFYDIVSEIAKKQGISMRTLSTSLGHSPMYISSAKTRGSIPQVDNAARIIDACGYTLCAVPTDNTPDDAFIIDWDIAIDEEPN